MRDILLMDILSIVVLFFIAFLVWGNLSRKSASHPLNGTRDPFTPTCSTQNTAGDNFGAGCSFTPGVPESTLPLTCCDNVVDHPAMPPTHVNCHHVITHFPVDPPPIAIQKPKPPVFKPGSGLAQPIHPVNILPRITSPKFTVSPKFCSISHSRAQRPSIAGGTKNVQKLFKTCRAGRCNRSIRVFK